MQAEGAGVHFVKSGAIPETRSPQTLYIRLEKKCSDLRFEFIERRGVKAQDFDHAGIFSVGNEHTSSGMASLSTGTLRRSLAEFDIERVK